jgi:CheY-like chemotaxis protein
MRPGTVAPRSDRAAHLPRILFIEDDTSLREATTDLLESIGFEVHAVGAGAEALLLLNSGRRFSHIFTDVVLPGLLNGFDLATFAVHLRPQPKVVMASAMPMWSLPRPPAGAVLIPKPYSTQDLIRHLGP